MVWTGQTTFKILPRHRKEAQTAFYTTSSGATTYAGPKEKRQKDAKNLNESILNVSDRIAFTEAKRKELGSFFTNNVWEFSHENEATPGRILKPARRCGTGGLDKPHAHTAGTYDTDVFGLDLGMGHLHRRYHHCLFARQGTLCRAYPVDSFSYLTKIKPIPLDKARSADPDSPATDKERTQLRALIGALQWAATQTSPHLQVHTSMLAGEGTKATVSTIIAANKALRFAKANSDVQLLYPPLGGDLEDLVFVAYSDAAFATRSDLSSQGGYRFDYLVWPDPLFRRKAKPQLKLRTTCTLW